MDLDKSQWIVISVLIVIVFSNALTKIILSYKKYKKNITALDESKNKLNELDLDFTTMNKANNESMSKLRQTAQQSALEDEDML